MKSLDTTGPKAPLVMVTWLDAAAGEFTEAREEAEPNTDPIGVIQRTVGYLIRDDEEGIILSPEFCEYNRSYRHLHEIPRAYIQQIQPLTFKRLRKKPPEIPTEAVG